jgi:hypothetical protein
MLNLAAREGLAPRGWFLYILAMRKQSVRLVILTAFLSSAIWSVGGDELSSNRVNAKTSAEETIADSRNLARRDPALLARVHWVGKQQLLSDTNAINVLSICKMPESSRLRDQTFDKLAQAPWRHSDLLPPINPVTLLRPLLEDLVKQEFLLEVRSAKDVPVEVVLAVRATVQQAEVWATNLSLVASALNGAPVKQATADLSERLFYLTNYSRFAGGLAALLDDQPAILGLSYSGGWMRASLLAGNEKELLSLVSNRSRLSWSPDTNRSIVYSEIGAKLRGANMMPEGAGFHPWCAFEADLFRAVRAVGFCPGFLTGSAWVSGFIFAQEGEVRTRALLEFPKPLGLRLDPWRIPTNLVSGPLAGFGAIRGIAPWFEQSALWKSLSLGTPPNQAIYWAKPGVANLHYMAFVSPEAPRLTERVTEYALRELNPKIAPSKLGAFERGTNFPGLGWHGIPTISPMLTYASTDGAMYLLAGFSPKSGTNHIPPQGLFEQIFKSPNTVWYDWESTPPCLKGVIPIGQLTRHLVDLPRLSPTNAALPWLLGVGAHLGNSVTGVEFVFPNQLALKRSSTVGFTAAELCLLADWLESPEFPYGLHTMLATNPPPFAAGLPAGGSHSQGTDSH